MKRIYFLAIVAALAGCSEKKPLTPEEQWHGYCTSMGNAARSIMLDRQSAIEKNKAIEHANKIDDEFTKKFILDIIEQVYAMPEAQIKQDKDAAREQIKTQITEKCLVTPHDKLPEYKQF
ncbi:hypothetical protein [Acinetobacter tandoii]|uniref:Lipoprotein n=1 Tax=Acinetobacter tandoii DSM 14970 = CIP 107469 TaxID=1120927 RepID=R9B2K0_9GAMM|nr:hypothetical protein [Acinetobacter tandoii]EOR08515.1 hypothetical protein I593_01271 [Acinetobacter tandoii DSM 14970 = CIP 107469]